jgi:hypothetical protein
LDVRNLVVLPLLFLAACGGSGAPIGEVSLPLE